MATKKQGRRLYKATHVYASGGYSEDVRKQSPSPADLQETYDMFEGFNVPIPKELPPFETYYQLERWRKKYIMDFLANKEKHLQLIRINQTAI